MKVAFLYSDKPRERLLADAFLTGAAKHGHQTSGFELGHTPEPGSHDVVAMFGVKSRELFRAHLRAGVHVVMLDKSYVRSGGFWRISVDSHHPTNRLSVDYPDDRWGKLGISMAPWRETGAHVLFAGSSAKYHAFYGLKGPTTYAQKVVRTLRSLTGRPIVYRPKPSWDEAVPVTKARFSRPPESIYDVLDGAWAVVTHGSNACFEALICGVPSIILGDGVLKPISSTSLKDIETPRLATEKERLKLARGLAYHQFTRSEFARGEAWDIIGAEVHA